MKGNYILRISQEWNDDIKLKIIPLLISDNEEVADPLILLAVIVIAVAVAAAIVVAVTLRAMFYCRKLKSASDGHVRDVTRFIEGQNVPTDSVKPSLV